MIQRLFSSLSLIVLLAVAAQAQATQTNSASVDEKSQLIIDKAIAAVGGASYLT